MVIVEREPFYPVEGLANNDGDRTAQVEALILRYLRDNPQVCSDDIYDEAMARFPHADPRFIGQGFRSLSKRKAIHKVGYRKSVRVEQNHSRDISVWEATR